MNTLKIKSTRFKGLGYACLDKSLWRFIDMQTSDTAAIGPYYKREIELLADLHRFNAEIYGADLL